MGLFGKSVKEIRREYQEQQRRLQEEQQQRIAYEAKVRQANARGWEHESDFENIYDNFIVPYESERRPPAYLSLVISLLGRIGQNPQSNLKLDSIALARPYEFAYPQELRLMRKSLLEARTNDTNPAVLMILTSIKHLPPRLPPVMSEAGVKSGQIQGPDRDSAKAIVLNLARNESCFDVIFLVCLEYGWLADLEQILRQEDRFIDVLKLLVFQKQWDVALAWLREHHKFAECVFVLEKAGRFAEAAAALEKLGAVVYCEFQPDSQRVQWTTVQQREAYERKLAQLRAFVAAAGQKPPPNLAALDEKFAYGEISKEEYEKLKTQAVAPATKTCPACGQPGEPVHKFCPHCGVKV